jgi:N-ethylmaleimide reductase
MSGLFTPFELGGLPLRNRVVMAPMTRQRALPGSDAPHALNAEYYAQRASAGLIVSEATQVQAAGRGYPHTPGIYTDEQIAGWRLVTDAVHASGGTIFAQLWHVGRFSHPVYQPDGGLPVAPSAIVPEGMRTRSDDGSVLTIPTPRALRVDELPAIAAAFGHGAACAVAAGFDGVEIHGASGYLIDQFLRDSANRRTDAYGGSPRNRMRFPLEVLDAVIAAAGAERVGIRLCPFGEVNGVVDSDPASVYVPFAEELSRRGIAYVHVVEGSTKLPRDPSAFDFRAMRRRFGGAWIVSNQYNAELAEEALASGYADLVAFGRWFVPNPDLVERLRTGAALNEVDSATIYGGGAKGYTDYPTLTPA